MGARLLAPGTTLAAVVADLAGVHGLAFWLVLAALPAAAAASFGSLGDALAGAGGWLRANSSTIALVLIVLGSVARQSAPQGAAVPALAVSTLVMALVCYGIPGLAWLFEPLRPRPRARMTTI